MCGVDLGIWESFGPGQALCNPKGLAILEQLAALEGCDVSRFPELFAGVVQQRWSDPDVVAAAVLVASELDQSYSAHTVSERKKPGLLGDVMVSLLGPDAIRALLTTLRLRARRLPAPHLYRRSGLDESTRKEGHTPETVGFCWDRRRHPALVIRLARRLRGQSEAVVTDLWPTASPLERVVLAAIAPSSERLKEAVSVILGLKGGEWWWYARTRRELSHLLFVTAPGADELHRLSVVLEDVASEAVAKDPGMDVMGVVASMPLDVSTRVLARWSELGARMEVGFRHMFSVEVFHARLARLKEAEARQEAYLAFAQHPAMAVRAALTVGSKLAAQAEEVLGWAMCEWPSIGSAMGLSRQEQARLDATIDPSGLPPSLLRSPKHFKRSKAPEFWSPELLPKLELKGGVPVPASTPDALRVLLAWVAKAPGVVFPEFQVIRERCTSTSRGRFARALLDTWLQVGAPNKEKWALLCAGYLGDDALAESLAQMIRRWPGEGYHARAELGLMALELIGTERALMLIYGISLKVKFKAIKECAGFTIKRIAKRRGLTVDELGDRLIPALNLDPDGSVTLDYGPRTFRVGFDELLVPYIRDGEGKRRKSLPKPSGRDDSELASAAYKAWGALKKEVETLASQQLQRLELALRHQRRWSFEDFARYFVGHPLIVHLVRHLVWGVYVDGVLGHTFRVTEDRTCASASDDAFTMPAEGQIGLVHPLELPGIATWREILADYEIVQPFPQLEREVFTDLDLSSTSGRVVPWNRVLALEKSGWRRSGPETTGYIHWMTIAVAEATISLGMRPGLVVAALSASEDQTLSVLDVDGELDPITLSELARDLSTLKG